MSYLKNILVLQVDMVHSTSYSKSSHGPSWVFMLSQYVTHILNGDVEPFSSMVAAFWHEEFSYNSLSNMWESSQLSILEIPLRTIVKGKIGSAPNRCFPTKDKSL